MGAPARLQMIRSVHQGQFLPILEDTPAISYRVMAGGAAETISALSGWTKALITNMTSGDVWVDTSTTAAVPAADVDTGAGTAVPIPSKGSRMITVVGGTTSISVYAASAGVIVAEGYQGI